MFCRTQWPSPDEYSQLETQTNLGRTDIVRWFKDHRSALKNGEALDWMDGVPNQGRGHSGSERKQGVSLEVTAVAGGFKKFPLASCHLFLAFYVSLCDSLLSRLPCTFYLPQWTRLGLTQRLRSNPSCRIKSKSSG